MQMQFNIRVNLKMMHERWKAQGPSSQARREERLKESQVNFTHSTGDRAKPCIEGWETLNQQRITEEQQGRKGKMEAKERRRNIGGGHSRPKKTNFIRYPYSRKMLRKTATKRANAQEERATNLSLKRIAVVCKQARKGPNHGKEDQRDSAETSKEK